MQNTPAVAAGALAETEAVVLAKSVSDATDENRPHCVVAGVYCESLGWLCRASACPASACCRSYWADAEAVAARG